MAATVDEYIASFPPETGAILSRVRATIHDVVPDAGEKISYQMPAITVDGRPLVHFAGWKRHLSLYPVPDDPALAQRLAPYRAEKSTLRFPFAEPVPYDLIADVVRSLLARRG